MRTISRKYSLIASDLNRSIRGRSPGEMLDAESVLAKRYKVNVLTVRQALGVLADQGLIRRHQGRGTVIADPLSTGHLAIVLSPKLLGGNASPFYANAVDALTYEVHKMHPRATLRMHFGRDINDGPGYPATLDLLEPQVMRDIRGVFAFHPLYQVGDRLREAGIPVVYVGGWDDPVDKSFPIVGFSFETFVDMALERLSRSQCRSIRLIWMHDDEKTYPESAWYKMFKRKLQPHDVRFEPHLMHPDEHAIMEKQGYRAMMQVWSEPDKPDGLMVTDDILCRGVLRASLQLGLEMPRDIKLVTFANQGVDFPYHRVLTRVEFDAAVLARKAAEKMLGTIRGAASGQAVEHIPGRLIEGETT
ncbi:MAG: substrate-binding domain-containing protein [Phycisphaeraceae bacterium]|nr:substrate-binding domain-containing protein [Phycisphaeraceae bacterium]